MIDFIKSFILTNAAYIAIGASIGCGLIAFLLFIVAGFAMAAFVTHWWWGALGICILFGFGSAAFIDMTMKCFELSKTAGKNATKGVV